MEFPFSDTPLLKDAQTLLEAAEHARIRAAIKQQEAAQIREQAGHHQHCSQEWEKTQHPERQQKANWHKTEARMLHVLARTQEKQASDLERIAERCQVKATEKIEQWQESIIQQQRNEDIRLGETCLAVANIVLSEEPLIHRSVQESDNGTNMERSTPPPAYSNQDTGAL